MSNLPTGTGLRSRLNMKLTEEEKMQRATKAALNKTSKGKLLALIEHRRRWSRKVTIATNKLADVDKQIAELATKMADTLFETEAK